VRILQAAGVETFESCEGGPGHAYSEPTIRFDGAGGDGRKALGVCFNNGLPVFCLRRVWYVKNRNIPAGPDWEIVFRERISPA
jgi:hypothetical protein